MSIDRIISCNPRFWGKSRQDILRKIWPVIDTGKRFTQKDMDAFIQNEVNAHPNRTWLKQLESVLSKLKDEHGFDVVLPAIPITVPRPSILPVEPEDFACLDGCYAMMDVLWEEWLAGDSQLKLASNHEKLIFAFGICLATDIGMHSIQVIDVISSLKLSDILDKGKSIKVKVHPRDKLNRYSIISLPGTCSLLLHSIMYLCRENAPESLLLFGARTPKYKRRKQRAVNLFNGHFKSLRHQTGKKFPEVPLPASWASFTRVAHLIAFYAGIEAFMITALRRYPLPVTPIHGSR